MISSGDEFHPGMKFHVQTPSEARVKLPKLEIPKFNGNIINWRGFWDQCKSAIHDKENKSEVKMFTYLKSFLADSAAVTFFGLGFNAENYKEAIDILEKQIG